MYRRGVTKTTVSENTALLMSNFDASAPEFDRHRALPDGAAKAVRAAVLAALPPHPRLLDLGAGSGRIGWPFVSANDNYVGADLSFAMLRAFRNRDAKAALVRADGCALPFRDRTFEAVLMVQIFGGLKRWRALIDEARRVLRPGGLLMLGRTQTPGDGVDAIMKLQLAAILGDTEQNNARRRAELHIEELASTVTQVEAARWKTARSPRGFLDRHAGGARFSQWPREVRESALRKLGDWAIRHFGSLDAQFTETHRFTLRTFRF